MAIKHNFTHFAKPFFFASILLLSIAALGLFELVDARHSDDGIVKDLEPGLNSISFRQSSNASPQSVTVDLDTSTAGSGFATITVTEDDSNLDSTAVDVVLSSATSTSSGLIKTQVQLFETDVDTGIFTGQIILSSSTETGKLKITPTDDVTVLYEPEHDGVGRFSADLNGVNAAGTVDIFDYSIDDPDGFATRLIEACPWDLVTHPVDVQLSQSTTADEITVTLSYANAILSKPGGGQYNPSELKMVYRFSTNNQIGAFEQFDFFGIQPTPIVDEGAMTITGTLPNNFFQTTLSGQYALGVKVDNCGGGGGGGLVRPGLVVNVLAGASAFSSFFGGGGGGGAGPNAPTVLSGSILSLDGTEFFDLYDSVDGIESILSNTDNSFDSTQTVNTNEPMIFVFDLYENGGINNLEHATLYMNIRGDETDVDSSDTYILFDRGQSTHIIDPHGIIENANFEILEKTAWDLVLKYDITFAKPMETSHIMIQSWDLDRHSSTKIFENALQVGDPNTTLITLEITEEIIPEPEILQIKSENIPIWVKNNAGWWSQELIDDSDFIAGIEYLIQNKIIIILDDQVVTSSETSYQIPQWIKNNAGWWSEDLITEKDFTEGLQWLISNGVIRVQ